MNTRHALLPRALITAMLLFLLSGCGGPRMDDYAQTTPALDLFAWFSGQTRGHGLVQESDGTLIRRFVVDITGTVNGDTLVLDERFSYDDGEKQQRIWTIRRLPDGTYRGTAPDVVGEAEGVVAGSALRWRYTLRVPARGREWDLAFDDWMFLVDERVMINRARFSKFGIGLGEVTLSFVREPSRPL
jgi:hypothetical protein